jgi:hypothetical protein
MYLEYSLELWVSVRPFIPFTPTKLTRLTHIASYLPLIISLRTLLSSHRRKHYTINVGKLNPAKLANFSEVECWVLVACSENGVVESKVCIRYKTHQV